MQLNEGKFSANGRCGYVLKPAYLLDETFSLNAFTSLNFSTIPSNSSSFIDPDDMSSFEIPVVSAETQELKALKIGQIQHQHAQFRNNNHPIDLSVRIISGRHLSRKDRNKGICSPCVEIEIVGMAPDLVSVKTNTISQFL